MTKLDPYKQRLLNWKPEDSKVRPENIDQWNEVSCFNRLPTKLELKDLGLDALTHGWLPNKPIINSKTRVLAIGSCFARYFILWFAEHGFNQLFPKSPYNALLT